MDHCNRVFAQTALVMMVACSTSAQAELRVEVDFRSVQFAGAGFVAEREVFNDPAGGKFDRDIIGTESFNGVTVDADTSLRTKSIISENTLRVHGSVRLGATVISDRTDADLLVSSQYTSVLNFASSERVFVRVFTEWTGPTDADDIFDTFAFAQFAGLPENGPPIRLPDIIGTGSFSAWFDPGRYGVGATALLFLPLAGVGSTSGLEFFNYSILITTIPTPAAATPLALAGLLAARRRR